MDRLSRGLLLGLLVGIGLGADLGLGVRPGMAGPKGVVLAPSDSATQKQRQAEADRLRLQGKAQWEKGDLDAALQSWQQAIKLYQEIGDRLGESRSANNIGLVYELFSDYSKALIYYQRSLAIAREIKDKSMETTALNHLGSAYQRLGNYAKAIESHEQSIGIAREIKDRWSESSGLLNLASVHLALGDYLTAIDYQEQSLEIMRELKDRQGESAALSNLGNSYHSLANYPKAIAYHEQSLAIDRERKRRRGEGISLNGLGNAYLAMGNYGKAIEYHQQYLAIAREAKDRNGEGIALGNLGLAYESLGNYAEAIEYHNQNLAIDREIKDRAGEGGSLHNLGNVYRLLGDYARAIRYYEQALAIAREIRNRHGEGQALNNLGIVYWTLEAYPKSIDYYEQSLAIAREIKDRKGEGQILGNLGAIYQKLDNDTQAIEYYEQSLAIARDIKNRSGEHTALNNLGFSLTKRDPELAIVFYKEAVSVAESIRTDTRKLDYTLQEAYTQTVAGTYRRLADLLLAQGRVLEAQQVLELLKVQELRDYTRDTRTGDETPRKTPGKTPGAPLNAIEAPVKPPFDSLISLGLKLTDCEAQKPRCAERDQLLAQRQTASAKFEQQSARLRRLARQQTAQDPAQLQQQELTVAANNILKAHPKSVLIYPLILEDKLWLVYGIQAGKEGIAFASQEIPVSRKELSTTVAQFRTLLQDSTSDLRELQQTGQKLYNWLIAPLRPQLDANGIQTLILSPDRATRYIPFAALHDGQQYLTQRFTISTILTAGLTNTTDKLSPKLDDNPVLGLGLSKSVSGFSALPNVAAEIDGIVRQSGDPKSGDPNGIFNGQAYLNQSFTLNAFKDLIDYRILHIATHGKFVSEDPEQSFLVLGNGQPLKVPDIRQLSDLGSIHLAVLSACETAKGGQDKEGIEVAGLSYYFLSQNVKSVIASLWLVSDASTSLLMQRFYQNLAGGKLTKAQALRQAQLSLLQEHLPHPPTAQPPRSLGTESIEVSFRDPNPATPASTPDFNHPYYWAPFILTGNGL